MQKIAVFLEIKKEVNTKDLNTTLNSILLQTYENIKVFVVGDQKYLKQAGHMICQNCIKIIILNNKNQFKDIINDCITKYDIEYISIAKVGAVWHKDKIKTQYENILKKNSFVNICDYEIDNKINNIIFDNYFQIGEDFKLSGNPQKKSEEYFLRFFIYGNCFSIDLGLFKTTVFIDVISKLEKLDRDSFNFYVELVKKYSIDIVDEKLISIYNFDEYLPIFDERVEVYKNFFEGISDEFFLEAFKSRINNSNITNRTEKNIKYLKLEMYHRHCPRHYQKFRYEALNFLIKRDINKENDNDIKQLALAFNTDKYNLKDILNETNVGLFAKKLFETEIDRYKDIICKLKNKLKNKEKIKVLFTVTVPSMWKYESVYNTFSKDENYECTVLVVTAPSTFGEYRQKLLIDTFEEFKNQGYNVVCSFQEGKWIDVREEIKPDIIFYNMPYKTFGTDINLDRMYDSLTCYVNYGYYACETPTNYFNRLFHLKLWRNYLETDTHKKLMEKVSFSRENVIVSGYPTCEKIKRISIGSEKLNKRKKIIIAPHQTIDVDSPITFSNFLKYSDLFLEIPKMYKNDIEILFKPHPFLKRQLYNHKDWGVEKTDEYYKKLSEFENVVVAEGEYIDVFNESDAMILDSISFVIEYMYSGKPSIFLYKNEYIYDYFNELGQKSLENMYKGFTKSDIINFIENVVINNIDDMKEKRVKFYNEYLIPPKGMEVSKTIYNDINSILKGE